MEGPSITIAKEEAQKFIGCRVLDASGNTKTFDIAALKGKTVSDLGSWGKVLYLHLGQSSLRVHFLMFGSYRIDEPKEDRDPRLMLRFKNGVWYFYTCSVRLGEPEGPDVFDPRVDVMSPAWSRAHVLKLLKKKNESELVCDLLLDQNLFSGVGNIIKNEVMYLAGLPPTAALKDVSPRNLGKLVQTTHDYCWQFYEWKKAYVLRKNWKVMRRRYCAVCETKILSGNFGKLDRRTFWCPKCQPGGPAEPPPSKPKRTWVRAAKPAGTKSPRSV